MLKLTRILGVLALVLATAPAANAFTLTLAPSTQSVANGGTVSIDAVISGLGAGAAPSLGTYDLNLSFDASLLSFSGLTFGTGLDVLGLGPGEQDAQLTAPGLLNVFENSFDTVADLNQFQPDSFVLFTLTFQATASGTATLSWVLGPNALISA